MPDLGGVEKFNPMPMRTDRLASFDGILQGTIQDRRGNLLLQLRGHIAHRFEQTIQIKSGFGRSENHRCVIEKKNSLLRIRHEIADRLSLTALCFDEVPFVQNKQRRFARILNQTRDSLVLRSHAAGKIAEQE